MSSTNDRVVVARREEALDPVPASRSSASSSQRPRVSCISLPNSSVTASGSARKRSISSGVVS